MNDQTDPQLLRAYAEHRSEPAFAELVRRHVDFVYSAARRMVCDSHLAEDVAQGVFLALAKNAAQLTDHPVLSGWLHRTAQNIAAQTVRTDVRRRVREQEAAAMTELLATEPDALWEHIAPLLDAALGELNEEDRDALLLRYFERKSAREMAQTLGTSEDAAQKRVNRAVERLREFFTKRGVTVGAGGLAVVISANAVQAAPAGLAVTISTAAAALAGTTIAATTTATVTKAIIMTTLQKTIIGTTLAAAVGAGIYEAHQVSTLRTQVQTLQLEQTPLAEQLTKLQTENERLSSQLAQARDSQALSKAQANELLKLRGKATLAQTDSRELASLKSTLAAQTGKLPDYLTNAMASGLSTADKWKKKDAQARLARMKKALNLTDDQERAINDIMLNHIQRQSQMTLDLMMGKSTPEQLQTEARDAGDQETEIKALFTPEQLAAFPEYTQAEKTTAAESSAASDAGRIADDFSLPREQQDKLRSLLFEMNLKEPAGGLNQQAITQAFQSGNLADAVNMGIELQKGKLEKKLKILDGFLSPQQITSYRQEQIDQINSQAAAMKMFLPQKPAGTTN